MKERDLLLREGTAVVEVWEAVAVVAEVEAVIEEEWVEVEVVDIFQEEVEVAV